MSVAVLSCTGLDKPEGSVAREVAIRLAEETGAEIICRWFSTARPLVTRRPWPRLA
jgi:hypothetical protein